MQIHEVGQLVHQERTQLGLTQEQLGHMANVSRATINGLENGNLAEIGFIKLASLCSVLSIDLVAKPHKSGRSTRRIAAAASGTKGGVKHPITTEKLREAFASGSLPSGLDAQVHTLLDEKPWPVVAQTVREAATVEHVAPKIVWGNLARWAAQTNSQRWKDIIVQRKVSPPQAHWRRGPVAGGNAHDRVRESGAL